MPLAGWYAGHWSLAFADGPTDAHKSQLARAYLKKAKPADGMFPSEHIPTRTAAALARYPNARDA
jgi:acyl-CoA dehydrogenase